MIVQEAHILFDWMSEGKRVRKGAMLLAFDTLVSELGADRDTVISDISQWCGVSKEKVSAWFDSDNILAMPDRVNASTLYEYFGLKIHKFSEESA